VADNESGLPERVSFFRRMEMRLLRFFPAVITPLRFRILLGYLLVLLLGIYGWEQITSAWRYVATLLAPVAALLGAVVALKISVVLVSLVTLLSAVVKLFIGFLMMVIKPGILKAIFIPQLLSLVSWFHRKSSRVQSWVRHSYGKVKTVSERVVSWWSAQSTSDKVLLFGFLIPLLVVLLIVFVVKRAIAIFAFKKVTEQVVQKSTRFIISNFHRVPVVGGLPAFVAHRVRKLTARDDRVIVVDDFKELGREFYRPDTADKKPAR